MHCNELKADWLRVTRFHILQAISLLLNFFTLFSWCFVFSFFYIIKNYQISTTYMWHAKVDDAEKSHHAILCVKNELHKTKQIVIYSVVHISIPP